MNTDTNEFRRVMGHFATGVTVVTTKCEGVYHGLTVNAFSSVSLDPMLILVNISKHASSHDLIQRSGIYAVNILSQNMEHVSRIFSDPHTENRFANIQTYEDRTGAPIIDGTLAYLDVRVVNTLEAGDHSIFIGEVQSQRVLLPDAQPLLYHRGGYAGIVPAPPQDVTRQVPRE